MKRLLRRRWPSLTQPSTLLLSTTVTTGMRYWDAVRSAFMVIAKPPSPHTATQSRSGKVSLAPGAAALEVVGHVEPVGAGVHGDDRALVEPARQLGDHALGTERHVVQALLW